MQLTSQDSTAPSPLGPQGIPSLPGAQKQGRAQKQAKQPRGTPAAPSANPLQEEINSVSRRLRVLEERYINLRRRLQVIDENLLSSHKKLGGDIKIIREGFTDAKRELAQLRQTATLILKELAGCARRSEIQVLDKYLSLWDPTSFVSYEEAERIARRITAEHKASQESPTAGQE
ncbi:hypothetical protein COY28_00370 [Candidatus Woesearchaeota archaeon CG_4_10_14_0_2_um_filter_57_5]|nr:MAG: hypothetical protein AUJ68_02280 [Candidatus Woesearchaeota archaeon CG1_02_57_44]PIN70828.1 MAG: hypothetical protein COV94_01100 [Candidatus Woesearchaeota archaeon CG11_big_fil_rev_8_21_14_0_20_57_5]PIZ57065.1 MAG: hypothetical protein COY28_00370 [Candidatus Woesearchaeota archaeon CG_4_10_14_0_2_um_filter_57_5]